jgi:TonB-linked SusC/RagA family outer membrane protein
MAQEGSEITVNGVVKSSADGEPLVGAAVMVKGTQTSTLTDLDGKFEISADPQGVIVVSYFGYKVSETAINGNKTLTISLTEDKAELDEVVIVGYGTQKKSHITGAVTGVDGEGLSEVPVARADQALIGKLAGVQILNTSTEPGAAPVIQVRGLTSISAGTSPLIVVDGYPIQGDLSAIDMNDVENIEVLKDAASTAIYGSRGANGVILVTTKGGNGTYGTKSSQVTFNSYAGVKTPIKKGIYPTPSEWYSYVQNNLGAMGLTDIPDEVREMNNLGTSTNWEDVMMRNGVVQNYQLGINGVSNNMKYYVGGSYLSDKGVLRNNGYEKYNLRINVSGKINKWLEVGVNANPSFSDQEVLPVGLHDALRSQPWLPEYHDANTLQYAHAAGYTDLVAGDIAHEKHFDDVNGVKLRLTSNNSSLAKVDGRSRTYNNFTNIANSYLVATISPDLKFRTSFGTFNSSNTSEFFQQGWSHRNANTEGTYSESKVFDWLSESYFTYTKRKDRNDLNVVAGASFQKTKYSNSALAANSFITDVIPTLNAGLITSGSTYKEEQTLASVFARANYAFDSKYLFSLSLRTDGSSKFGANNRWGFFPAASVGWRISKEDFFEPMTDVMNNLKVRLSYGVTGNNGIPNYSAFAKLSPVNSIIGDNVVQGFTPTSTANPDLSWEQTYEINFGIDMAFARDRVYFSVDLFRAETDRLLLNVPIPSVTGFTNEFQNVGSMRNSGVDFNLNAVVIDKEKFDWNAGFNISAYKNELLEFGGLQQVISTPDSKRPSQFIAEVGSPLVQYYGYQTESQIGIGDLSNPSWPVNVGSNSVFVKDVNGDGVIDDKDRTVIGSPFPDFIWGFTNSFSYENWDLSFTLQGSQGGEVFNIDPYYYESHWRGGNTLAADDAARTQLKVVTDDMVQDASFVALRTLNLGYTLPKSWTKSTGVRIYFTGYNLFYKTAKNYTSYNPEGVNLFTDNPLTQGYQRGAAPQYRTFAGGLSLTF